MTRMIERWFPSAEVSANSDKGWGSGNSEISLFMWFAKRPTAQAKAAIVCSLLPWPDSEHEQLRLQELVRKAMTGRYGAWSDLRTEILQANPEGAATLDPFSGRGMIPLEAARLGISSDAIDYSPVAPGNPDEANRSDRVADLGSYFNDTDYLSQVVRVFASPEEAAAYPDALRSGIAACPEYSVSFSDGDDFWSTDVVPTEFPTSSPAVTAVGWTEEYAGYAVTVVDLQYANLVVRTIHNRDSSSAIAGSEIAAFVLEFSGSLERLG